MARKSPVVMTSPTAASSATTSQSHIGNLSFLGT
jgi:hypothetical protein